MPNATADRILTSFNRPPSLGKPRTMRVSVGEFEGQELIHFREWIRLGDKWIPTQAGIAIRSAEMDSLISALCKARKARKRAKERTEHSRPVMVPPIAQGEYTGRPPWEDWEG